MIRPVLAYPNNRLREKTIAVTAFDDELKAFATDLCDTMEVATGAGLAAPQIGSRAKVFAISKHVSKTDAHQVFINPVIETVSAITQTNLEGCLSFHGEFLSVKRPYGVTISYQDLSGEKRTLEATGYYAQAILHEHDHLEGRLLIDYAPVVKREMINKRSKKLAGKMLDYRNVQPPSGSQENSPIASK